MFFLKTVTFFALLVSQFPVMAQGLELESGGVSVEYDTIDISGEYSNRKPRPLTPSEKLKIYRGKMVQRNHMIMEKKLETMRIKAEIRLLHRMQEAFDEQMQLFDEEEA